jgi:hypothetical protein
VDPVEERAPGAHWVGGYVSPRFTVDGHGGDVKSPCPCSSANSQFLLNDWETRIAYEILMGN